jgi:hypothetical protein
MVGRSLLVDTGVILVVRIVGALDEVLARVNRIWATISKPISSRSER